MVPWCCKLAHYQCLKGNDDMLIIQSTNVMSHFSFYIQELICSVRLIDVCLNEYLVYKNSCSTKSNTSIRIIQTS